MLNLISSLPQTIFWIAAIIFFITSILLVYSVIGFQRQTSDDDKPRLASPSNVVLETLWTFIPTGILVVLLVLTFQSIN